jgi:hypothetical protein
MPVKDLRARHAIRGCPVFSEDAAGQKGVVLGRETVDAFEDVGELIRIVITDRISWGVLGP